MSSAQTDKLEAEKNGDAKHASPRKRTAKRLIASILAATLLLLVFYRQRHPVNP
jgi:hypothetical protein